MLAAQGISVHGVYPGGIDTDMFAGVDAPKTPPAAVAASLLDVSPTISKTSSPTRTRKRWRVLWRIDPKAFKRAFCGAVAA